MDARLAAPVGPDPVAVEFVRFCYRRRRVGWPDLYDEMCAVAARGLFRGMSADDLAGVGIGLALFDMPALASLSAGIVAEEQAKRRPVAVRIAAPEPVADEASEVVSVVVPDPVPDPVPDLAQRSAVSADVVASPDSSVAGPARLEFAAALP